MTFTDIVKEELAKIPSNDPYENSAWKALNSLPSATKGAVSEKCVAAYLQDEMGAYAAHPQEEFDLWIEGLRVELKSCFVNKSGGISVNHVRYNYEYDLLWLAFYMPDDKVYIREIPKEEVHLYINNRHGKRGDDDYGRQLSWSTWSKIGTEVMIINEEDV